MTQERAETRTPEQRIQEAIEFLVEPLIRYQKGHVEFRDPDYKLLLCTYRYLMTKGGVDSPPEKLDTKTWSICVVKAEPDLDLTYFVKKGLDYGINEVAGFNGARQVWFYPLNGLLVKSDFGIDIPLDPEPGPDWTATKKVIKPTVVRAEYLEKIASAVRNARHGSVPA